MSKLSAFLHPVTTSEEKEVVISNRFQDESGQPVPFKIRALTQEENDAITRQATRRRKEGGQTIEQLDSVDFTRRMVVAATVEPDFSSKELCDGCGVLDPLLVPGKLLLSGEYARLVKEITKLSGFAEQEDEVKLMDGAGWDTEMLVAYYCFVNLGWAPSRYDALPSREKRLVTEFALKSMRDQKEAQDRANRR